jgi:hypothetical protein
VTVASGSSYETATRSSCPPSTRFSPRPASIPSEYQCSRRERTPSPNVGFGRSAKSAWTTSSSCQVVSSSPCFAVTSAITTKPVPIEAFTSTCPSRPQARDMPARSGAAMSSAASSTSTSALPDGGPRPSAALDHLHIGLGRARR